MRDFSLQYTQINLDCTKFCCCLLLIICLAIDRCHCLHQIGMIDCIFAWLLFANIQYRITSYYMKRKRKRNENNENEKNQTTNLIRFDNNKTKNKPIKMTRLLYYESKLMTKSPNAIWSIAVYEIDKIFEWINWPKSGQKKRKKKTQDKTMTH